MGCHPLCPALWEDWGSGGPPLPQGVPGSRGPAALALRWGSLWPCLPCPVTHQGDFLWGDAQNARPWPPPLSRARRARVRPASRAGHGVGASQQSEEMGRPPEPPGAQAPVGTAAARGTTAAPRPAPGLVHWTAWPRWTLVAVAVTTGVLVVSCLLCALCCCRCRRRRPRKKPGDPEAVGLGSARSSTTTHLVQPEVDGGESGPGGAPQWGRLQLSLEYDSGSQEVRVGLKQAVDLRARGPGGTADPFARLSLCPQAGRTHETRVHRGTLCPVFDETCRFPVPPQELPRTALRVEVLHFRRFSPPEPLGELRLPLGAAGLPHVLELWHRLGPPSAAEAEPVGELCVSLRYVPSAGQLTVVVLEARGLSPGLAEPYVKLQLVRSRRKWKSRRTSSRKGTAAPYFNEAFTFHVPVSQVQSVDLVLAVWARGPRRRAEPVGKVVLGARASGQPLQHWADMLARARRPIAQWHRLRPAGEVDETLALRPRLRLPLPGS